MFGIGFPELILILIIGLVVFGPGKLPEIGRGVGKALQEFKKASSEFSTSLNDSTKSSITPTPPNPANPGQPSVPPVFMQENAQNNSVKPAENKPADTASNPSAPNTATVAAEKPADTAAKQNTADIKNDNK